MKVNLDGLRRSGAFAYNSLVRKLNNATNDGQVEIDADDIRVQLRDLCNCIATLIALEGGEDDLKAMEIDLLEFNPEDE